MPFFPSRRAWPSPLFVAAWLAWMTPTRADLPRVPEGFSIRLVASVPAVEYPSQVATSPSGDLFVAEDPMDQVGPYEAFDARILRFRDGQEPVEYARGFRAIQGMAWHDGALYVSHMPFLTIVRDTDADGKADTKDNLFKDLGQTANKGLNDHIVSGIQFGMDGWLYISSGDKGVPGATRPEDGVKVQLKGGGTLRCRPDGRELEIYSFGTRNHLEPNLSPLDDLFTYDNTDDGDGWWTRVTHHINGGYYGYPYDYHDRPDRFLPPMGEYGGGSPCGGIVYKEDAWPEKYQGMAFWAEWGKGKVQAVRFKPKGSSFAIDEMIDFAVPANGDTFRPIDLALSHDGKTLYIADWNMGGWGKEEKVGRVFAVTYTGDVPESTERGQDSDSLEAQIQQLDHPSFNERMRAQAAIVKKGHDGLGVVNSALFDQKTPRLARRHLVWALDAIAGGTPEATEPLTNLLTDPDAEVRAQAARALGQRKAPLEAARIALETLVKDSEPTVRLQALIALGRIGQPESIPAIIPALADPDVFLSFSARVALRRIGDWSSASEGLKSPEKSLREGVLQTLELQYHLDAARSLATYALDAAHPEDERAKALRFLAEVHRKAEPWDGKWWGTRPTRGNPPAKVIEWEGTSLVIETIRTSLFQDSNPVRLAAVNAVFSTSDKTLLPVLADRFASEPDADLRASIASTLGKLDYKPALPRLVAAMLDGSAPDTVREAALSAVESIGTDAAETALLDLFKHPDLPVDRQPRVITALGNLKARSAIPALIASLDSPSASVRASASTALGQIGDPTQAAPALRSKLSDPDLSVRKAAIQAEAVLRDREAVPALIDLAQKDETRFEATLALAEVSDVKALQIYLRGLSDKSQELRLASSRALSEIREDAAPILDQLASRHELPPTIIGELQKIYTALQPIRQWQVVGPLRADAKPLIAPDGSIDPTRGLTSLNDQPALWRRVRAGNPDGSIDLGKFFGGDDRSAFAYAEIPSDSDRKARFAVGSDDSLTVWINGKQVYNHPSDRGFTPAQDEFDADLKTGTNHLVLKCGNHGAGWQFSVAVRAESPHAFLKAPSADAFNPESYRAFANKTAGKPDHGKALFTDLKGLACIKCHAVSGQGGTVGPDLSGVGAQYKKDEIIESVLYPSAKIFSGYEPIIVATSDGRVLNGILKSDDANALVIQDAEDKTLTIPKDDIEDQRKSDVSLMPNGLAEGLSREDFADLISYLETLKDAKPASASK